MDKQLQVDDADDSISIVSLNTIADDNNRENLELWSKIKMKLKRYFTSRLLNLKWFVMAVHKITRMNLSPLRDI